MSKHRVLPWLAGLLGLLLVFVLLPAPQTAGASAGGESAAAEFPLRFTEISLDGPPARGGVSTLTVQFTSRVDDELVVLEIDLLEDFENGLAWVSGPLRWEGALQAGEFQSHQLQVRVLEDGSWPVHLALQSYAGSTFQYEDFTVFRLSTPGMSFDENAQPLIESELQAALSTEPELMPLHSLSAPQPPDELTIHGSLTYEAFVREDGQSNVTSPTALRRAGVKLWEITDSGPVLLQQVVSDAQGEYRFDPVPNRDDLELAIEVVSTDFERIEVTTDDGRLYSSGLVHLAQGVESKDLFFPTDPVNLPSQPFYVNDLLAYEAYEWLASRTSWQNDDLLRVEWPSKCVLVFNNSCFTGAVHILEPHVLEPDLTLHEYGHFVFSRHYDAPTVINACLIDGYYHEMFGKLRPSCAWSEGWADFFQMAVQDDPDYRGGNLEDMSSRLPNIAAGEGKHYEGIVAATLWDLFDKANEPHDVIHDGFNGGGQGIWEASTTIDGSFNIDGFWERWDALRGVTCDESTLSNHHVIPLSPIPYEITTAVEPAVSPPAGTIVVSPSSNCPNDKYAERTTIEFQAQANGAYVLERWKDGAGTELGNDLTLEITVVSDLEVIAEFFLPTPTPTPTPVTPTPTPVPSTGFSMSGPYNFSITTAPGQQYGRHTVAVDQPPNTAFAGIVIWTDYHRVGYSDSVSLGYIPSLHGASSPWDYGSGWYCRDSNHSADRGACSFAANRLGGQSFKGTRPLSYWNRNGFPGQTAYSSFYVESTPCCSWPSVTGQFQVYYIWNGEIPSPTGTPTAGPTPTPTTTTSPTPQPTPTPCTCTLLCRLGILVQSMPDSTGGLRASRMGLLVRVRRVVEYIDLLQDLRDEIMVHTEQGQEYIDLYVTHSPELTDILFAHDPLWQQGQQTIELFLPGFNALLKGRGEEVVVTEEMVDAVSSFLAELRAVASPELQAVIDQHVADLPLADLAGRSFAEAQGRVLGNAPPVADIGGPYAVEEWGNTALAAVAIDPDGDPLSFAWDLDNDGIFDREGAETTFDADGLDGPYPFRVGLLVCDGLGGCDRETTRIEILNVPPQVDAGPDQRTSVGDVVQLQGAWSDPAGEADGPYDWSWDLDGDGEFDMQSSGAYGDGAETPVQFLLGGVYTLTLQIRDNDGGVGEDQLTIIVSNQPPVFDAGADMTLDEGEPLDRSAAIDDPDSSSWSLTIDYGDDSPVDDVVLDAPSFSIEHRYADEGTYAVVIEVCDDSGACTADGFTVTVRNVAPLVSAAADPIAEGTHAFLEAFFTDPGVNETHTAVVDWGDGSRPQAVAVATTATGGTIRATRPYGDNGEYTVTVTVTDDDGGEGQAETTLLVSNLDPTAAVNEREAIDVAGEAVFLGRVGEAQSHRAEAEDAGSDDLTFAWSTGRTETYFNNGESLDPPQSPGGIYPFSAEDEVSVAYDQPGLYALSLLVSDDDGGSVSLSYGKLVTGAEVCTRSQGFWKHQFAAKGNQHVDDATLAAYLEVINWASRLFPEQLNLGSLDAAKAVIDPKGPDMRPKAQAQLLSAWLNFASGAVGWDELVDTDRDGAPDMSFHAVMEQAEAILLNPDASHEELVRAKDLVEAANLMDEGSDACSGDGGGGGQKKPG
jgi:hypothetical protein